jgi:hypothetical protein
VFLRGRIDRVWRVGVVRRLQRFRGPVAALSRTWPAAAVVVLGLVVALRLVGASAAATSARSALVPPPPKPTLARSAAATTHPTPRLSGVNPGFTTNARVNQNAASLDRTQVEPSVASNPRNRRKMVAGYADYAVGDAAPGAALSNDGGVTWSAPKSGGIMPNPPGLAWGNRRSAGHVAAGDSSVAWGLGETVFFSTLGTQDDLHSPTPGVCDVGGLYVYRSKDGGNHWTLPAHGPAIANTQELHTDKELIAADGNPKSRYKGSVYMVWNQGSSGCATEPHPGAAMFSRSRNGGVTWSTPVALAIGCAGAPMPAVAANGDLYVAWLGCDAGHAQEVVRKSTDGGSNFGPATVAASFDRFCGFALPGSKFRTLNNLSPQIATDPTNKNRVFLASGACSADFHSDVHLERSLDAGATWSAPVRMNDDPPGDQRDQFFPAITVDDRGVVRAMWGDDRLDTLHPGGHDYDIFGATSLDHGATFGPNTRISDASSNPDNDFGGSFIGDYFWITPCGTALWTDTRNGAEDIYSAAPDASGDGKADSCRSKGPPK